MTTKTAIADNHAKPSCPKCGGNTVYIKTSTNEIVCRRCGTISKRAENSEAPTG